MKAIRILTRIGMMSAAAVIFMALTGLYAHSIRPPVFRFNPRIFTRERRPAEPRLNAVPKFVGECFLFALITVGGRKLLRLRLEERSPF